METKTAYVYNSLIDRRNISLIGLEMVFLNERGIPTLHAGHYLSMAESIKKLKGIGYKLIYDKDVEGKNRKIPQDLRNKLEELIA